MDFCPEGQQIRLPFESDTDSNTTKEKLLKSCDCRTKSVQILTPSQEKDEQQLWPSSDARNRTATDLDLNESFDNNKHRFCSKYCAKCDKLLTNLGFDYTNTCDKSEQAFNEDNQRSAQYYYCDTCDNDGYLSAGQTGGHNCSHQYQCHQRKQSIVNNSDNLSLYSLHMEKDFRYELIFVSTFSSKTPIFALQVLLTIKSVSRFDSIHVISFQTHFYNVSDNQFLLSQE